MKILQAYKQGLEATFNSTTQIYCAALLLFCHQICDVMLTFKAVRMGVPEGNPFMNLLINMGWGWFFFYKLLACLLIPFLALAPKTLLTITAIYTIVVGYSTYWLYYLTLP